MNAANILPLGRVAATPGVLDVFPEAIIHSCLARHEACDWGDVSDSDRAANDAAFAEGGRILSSYNIRGDKLWIITNEDREATTVLLPNEY